MAGDAGSYRLSRPAGGEPEWRAAWDYVKEAPEGAFEGYEFWGDGDDIRAVLTRDLIELRTAYEATVRDVNLERFLVGDREVVIVENVASSDEDFRHRAYRLDAAGVLVHAGFDPP